MPPDSGPKSVRGGLSLYANLLDPSCKTEASSSTISRAPVVFQQPLSEDTRQDTATIEKQQLSAASLRFQPTKRPQLSSQKPKPKPPVQRASLVPNISAPDPSPPDTSAAVTRAPAKTTLADWTAEADDNDINGFYGGQKRQRGGKKRRKKNKEEARIPQNWDDIYDPSRPNNYEDYKHSDEKILEIREWKDKIYAHRVVRQPDGESSSDDEDRYRPQMNKQDKTPGLSFAPPPSFDAPAPLPPHVNMQDDPTGEDAYARRLNLSQPASKPTGLDPPLQSQSPAQPSLPVKLPPTESKISTDARSAPAPEPSISRAPVRYNLPPAPPEIPSNDAELESALQTEQTNEEPCSDSTARSLRPGQKGFAERLMSKYGWSKGSGLGASGSGITAPLRVQVEKQKKKPDSEGGGFVGPGGMGKIIGGKKKGGAGGEEQGGKFGTMSEVVVLKNMVDGMDLDAELGAGDGGLMQEIGEECGEKYGRVERVYINRNSPLAAPVFVKFTSQLSALRAVNALQGRIFNGNTITARFFENEKFEKGIYD